MIVAAFRPPAAPKLPALRAPALRAPDHAAGDQTDRAATSRSCEWAAGHGVSDPKSGPRPAPPATCESVHRIREQTHTIMEAGAAGHSVPDPNPARGERHQGRTSRQPQLAQKPQRPQATGCALPDDHGQLTRRGACQIRNRSHSFAVHHPEGLCCTVQDKASGSWEWRRCRAGCHDHGMRRSWVSAPVRRL